MKYIKRQNIIVIGMILLLLIFSNKIIINIFDLGAKIENIDLKELNSADEIKIHAEKVELQNIFSNTYQIGGWSFVKDRPELELNHIYIKGNNIYTIESIIYDRGDVVKHFKEQYAVNKKSGFISEFSTVGIDNGKYEVIVKFIDKKGNDYLYYTNICYEKNDKKIYKVDCNENKNYSNTFNISKKDILNEDNISMNVENNKNSEKGLNILGWAYLKDINKTGKVYVGIKDKTGKEIYYTTEHEKRPDVVIHFDNNADLLNSGFKANINIDSIEDYQLSSIVIEYDGKYYRQEIDKKEAKAQNIKSENYSNTFNISKKDILNEDSISMNIENNKNSEKGLNILGWAYLKDLGKTGKIYVGIKDKTGKEIYYTTELEKRPDVVTHFDNNADLLYSGFRASINIDNVEEYQLSSIIIEYDGKYYRKAVK